jgi:dTDP-4-amino-4,6-dideoxygalactose transaminase
MIPFYKPGVGQPEIDAIATEISRGILSTGEVVEKFESEFAAFCGRPRSIAVTSGSVALEFALEISSIDPGDQILVSPFNCSAVLYAIVRSDLQPVFVDIDPQSLSMDPEHARTILKTSENITGLLLTPTYGLPPALDSLLDLADRHNLTVVNDFAQAVGATHRGDPIGSFGDIGVCSFGATKNITTG